MSDAPATLVARDGSTSAIRAELVTFGRSARWARAGGAVLAGIALGIVLIPVPPMHLVAPWLMPLLGLGLAAYLLGIRARIASIRGPCPRCAAEVAATELGSVGSEPVWVRCSGCGAPLEVRLPEQPR